MASRVCCRHQRKALTGKLSAYSGISRPSRPILSVTFISSGCRTGTRRCSTAP